jgi:hypothetical protein
MSVRATEGGTKEQGHGHGMSRNRTPKRDNLPHDGKRDDKQPYAREVEDYTGEGVTSPPQDKGEKRDERRQASSRQSVVAARPARRAPAVRLAASDPLRPEETFEYPPL